MTFTLPALLSVFTLLAIASWVYFLSVRTKFPYTVLLVAVGAFILVPLSTLAPFSFLREFVLTPELLLYVFLPVLLFESAYNINTRRLFENILSISVLSVVSLVVSAGVTATGLYFLLPLVGIETPFLLCFLFGSLISATDPVAVLALFKEVGAPRRLTLLFEGESIFNDGTAVALFLVVLGIATGGWHGSSSVFFGIADFAIMVLGGIALGIGIGLVFVRAVDRARSNEFVQIALMIVLAHFTFLFSDFLSEHLALFGHKFHLSAIIATTMASIVMGNYGRAKILPRAQEFVEKFWIESAFLANSIVFLLIGFVFVALPISPVLFIVPIAVAVLVVAVARAFSIYPVVWLLNKIGREEPIPLSWQHLLSWGSLRGALALTMALLVPDDLSFAGWTFSATPKEFVLALTVGCIFATLFLKATTITRMIRSMRIDALTDLERAEIGEAGVLVRLRALERIGRFAEKGYIEKDIADTLKQEYEDALRKSCDRCHAEIRSEKSASVGERVLRLYMIGVEKEMLDTLYDFGEVTERVYRRVSAKLALQYEYFEEGQMEINPSKEASDPLLRAIEKLRSFLHPKERKEAEEDLYLYYRTQNILSRSALRALRHIDARYAETVFGERATEKIQDIYETFLQQSLEKMQTVEKRIPEKAKILSEQFARRSVLQAQSDLLEELFRQSMMTPKVRLALAEEIEHEARGKNA